MKKVTFLPGVVAASAALLACSDSTEVAIDATSDTMHDTSVDQAPDDLAPGDLAPGDGQPDGMQGASRRILFVVDTSQSMLNTDPVDTAADPLRATSRARAIAELIDRYIDLDPSDGSAPEGGAAFAIISFNSATKILTTFDGTQGFTIDPAVIERALPGVNAAQGLTDYEGALGQAMDLLATDIAAQIKVPPAAVEQLRYTVVFLSDGPPDPQISDATDWDSLRPEFVEELIGARDPSTLPQYNVESRILEQVKGFLGLRDQHGLEQLSLHTAYLGPSGSRHAAEQLLKDMAKAASSTYRRFDDPTTLDLSAFLY